MPHTEKTIEVRVPVRTAYNQWTQFEEFPRFMEHIDRVEQIDDTTLRWVASMNGETREWTAEITEQQPDRVIAWHSTSGVKNDGTVTFEPVDDQKTRVSLRMEYEPQDTTEQVGSELGLVDREIDTDLENFKRFIEERGEETGAWRGQVD